MRCKRCGTENNEENIYCIKCGRKLDVKHKHKVIIVIVSIILVVILLVVGYFLWTKYNVDTELISTNNSITINGSYYPQLYDKNSGDVFYYSFDNGNVKNVMSAGVLTGTYTQNDNKINIIFEEYYDNYSNQTSKKNISKVLTIDNENKLIDEENSYNNIYIKTNDLVEDRYIGLWAVEMDGKNMINIDKIYRDDIVFSLSLYADEYISINGITATLENNNIATFTTSSAGIDLKYQGIYGTLEFGDKQIILTITTSSFESLPAGETYTYKYHEDINADKLEIPEITDMTGINGTYAPKDNDNSQYLIQNNQIIYEEMGEKIVIRQGTYKRDGNKLFITYEKQYNCFGELVELELKSEELTIENGNIVSSKAIYEKELTRNVQVGCWTDETEGANAVTIREMNNNSFTFDLGIFRTGLIENITATMQSDSWATFNTDNTQWTGIDGVIEFKDNTVILRITYSLNDYVKEGLTFTCDHII